MAINEKATIDHTNFTNTLKENDRELLHSMFFKANFAPDCSEPGNKSHPAGMHPTDITV